MAWNNYGKPKVALPVNHCEKDAQWLTEQLLSIPAQHRITACVGYSEAYLNGYKSTDVQHKKENLARRTANIKMREFVAKCKAKTKRFTPPAQNFGGGFELNSL